MSIATGPAFYASFQERPAYRTRGAWKDVGALDLSRVKGKGWVVGARFGQGVCLEARSLMVRLQRGVHCTYGQHICWLGGIHCFWLPSFYAGLDPDVAARVQGPGWERLSAETRALFWFAAMRKLATFNLSPDDLIQAIAAINARVPLAAPNAATGQRLFDRVRKQMRQDAESQPEKPAKSAGKGPRPAPPQGNSDPAAARL